MISFKKNLPILVLYKNLNNAINIIKKDKIKIKNLVGINGIINENEFKNLLDKNNIVG